MADLSFETRVDLSGLNSGVAQAEAKIGQFANTTKQAMASAAAAAEQLADAQRQLGEAAAQGSAQASAVISDYQHQVDEANAAVERLTATETRETQAVRSSVSARMAASAELRIFEGNTQGSTRAVAALISQFPLLAAAAQAAFTGFALVAVGEIAYDVGKKLYDAFDLGGKRAEKTAEEIRGVNNELERSTTALNVQIDKLQQEEAKLEKKPFNGLKLVLDEAAGSAQILAARLEAVAEREKKVIEGMSASKPQLLLGGSQTGYEQTMLQEHAKWLATAKNTQDSLNESTSYGNSLQTRLTQLLVKQKEGEELVLSAAQSGASVRTTDYGNEIKAIQQLISWQQQEQQNIKATISLNKEQGVVQGLKDAKSVAGPKGPDLDTSRLKVIEEQFAELTEAAEKIHGRGLTAGEAAAFWAPFLSEFEVDAQKYRSLINQAASYEPGSSMSKKLLLESQKLAGANEAYKHVLDEINKETQTAHKALFSQMLVDNPSQALQLASGFQEYDQALKAVRRDADEAAKANEYMAEGLKATHKMMEELADATAKAALQTAKLNNENAHQKAAGGIELQATKVQAGQSLGLTDPLKDLELLRDLHQQALAEDERYIQQQMALDEQAAQQEKSIHQGDDAKIREIQSQLDNQLFELNKKLTADQQKAEQQKLIDTEKILQQQVQKYRTAYAAITQDFNSAITKMITTTEKPAQAFAQMLNEMIGQLANFVLQYLEKKAEMWLMDEILGKTAATSSAVTQIMTDAAVAGAGAFAATAVIPFVGPALAPAAAASAYAGTLSFLGLAAFEAGGVVNGSSGMPVPIMAHAGERVLSASQTQNFHSLVDSRQGGSNSNHLTYAPQINAYDRSGMRSILQSHKDDIMSIVRSGYKTGGLG